MATLAEYIACAKYVAPKNRTSRRQAQVFNEPQVHIMPLPLASRFDESVVYINLANNSTFSDCCNKVLKLPQDHFNKYYFESAIGEGVVPLYANFSEDDPELQQQEQMRRELNCSYDEDDEKESIQTVARENIPLFLRSLAAGDVEEYNSVLSDVKTWCRNDSVGCPEKTCLHCNPKLSKFSPRDWYFVGTRGYDYPRIMVKYKGALKRVCALVGCVVGDTTNYTYGVAMWVDLLSLFRSNSDVFQSISEQIPRIMNRITNLAKNQSSEPDVCVGTVFQGQIRIRKPWEIDDIEPHEQEMFEDMRCGFMGFYPLFSGNRPWCEHQNKCAEIGKSCYHYRKFRRTCDSLERMYYTLNY